jgi:GNAT superfamily N-acetyltransferase
MNKNELISIRPFVESDKNFVMATILRGLFYGDSWFSRITKHIFMEHYKKVVEYLINKPNTEVRVACLKEDPEVILGYSIVDEKAQVIHWVFVKQAWRKIGIAKSLVPKDAKWVSHLTKVGLSIIAKTDLQFNPFTI